jgi:ribosomal-protein-alanine N-acetyltransferase
MRSIIPEQLTRGSANANGLAWRDSIHIRTIGKVGGMKIALETKQLLLRPLELVDAAQVQPLFARWEIAEFLNDKVPWPFPDDGVLNYYREIALPAMERGDEWHWTLRLKAQPEQVIGSIGLMRSAVDDHAAHNRGFWLGAEWHGQGLMTEAVVAANDFWFDVLGFDVLRTSKAVANGSSRRISEKTGMRVVGRVESGYGSGRWPSETWEITAGEWWAWRLSG